MDIRNIKQWILKWMSIQRLLEEIVPGKDTSGEAVVPNIRLLDRG